MSILEVLKDTVEKAKKIKGLMKLKKQKSEEMAEIDRELRKLIYRNHGQAIR